MAFPIRLTGVVALGLVSLASTALADAQAGPSKVYNVRDYGADGDGETLDTKAIQQALDDCGRSGGGIVRLPAGTYLSQPIFLKSHTTLELAREATLLGTGNQEDYLKPDKPQPPTSSSSFYALVNGKRLTNVVILGKGTIDGGGSAWWDAARHAKLTNPTNSGYTMPRPRMVLFENCKDVRVEGVTLANSPSFHLVPKRCEDVVVKGVTITAPDEAVNSDGIDPSMCRRVQIADCVIDVGDDNIAIKSGSSSPEHEFACEDISITDCVFRNGHGVSIGSETKGGVRNVTVERCSFTGTENGLRIKSRRGRGGRVENIIYRDIQMTNVDPAITITCYYPKIPTEDAARPVTPATPAYRNIRIANLTATCPKEAGLIVGLPESPVETVILDNVHITSSTGLILRNGKAIQMKEVTVTPQQGEPFFIENAPVEGLSQTTPNL